MAEESTVTIYVVQRWVGEHGYNYWTDTLAKQSERLFETPVYFFESADEAKSRVDELRGEYPDQKYRVVSRTTTETVIA